MGWFVGSALVIALFAHLAFTAFAIVNLYRKITGRALLLASVFALAWITSFFHPLAAIYRIPAEILTLLAWQILTLRALGFRFRERRAGQALLSQVAMVIAVTVVSGLLIYGINITFAGAVPMYLLPLCFIVLNIAGLVLVEQLARNVVIENLWRIRYLNIGLSLIFGFGLLVWSLRLAISSVAEILSILQPVVFSLALIPLVIASLRNRSNRLQFNLSRQFVFRTGVLAAAGFFLIGLSLLTYISQIAGGDLGLTVAIFVAVVLLVFIVAITGSTRFRSTAKVVLTKTFFESRYDYREEWTELTRRLSEQQQDYTLHDQVQLSLINILYAKSSSLWLFREGVFNRESMYGESSWPRVLSAPCNKQMQSFFLEYNWVLDLNEVTSESEAVVTAVRAECPQARFLVPLFLSDSLYAICLIGDSEVREHQLDWEDFDILKLVARQGASYLALDSANKALIENEKFAAVAQMSAFLSHDIKTINAQLTLLLENAKKHKDNPAFIDDMLKTIENSTQRMSKISIGLNNPSAQTNRNETCDLAESLTRWHALDMSHHPRISISCPEGVNVPPEYLTAINHLANNAIESSPDAHLTITVSFDSNFTYIRLNDTGPGMSDDFIKNKLFEPFHSSKGVSGMGIGAYQSKTIVEKYGGRLFVDSTPGTGSQFTIEYGMSNQK